MLILVAFPFISMAIMPCMHYITINFSWLVVLLSLIADTQAHRPLIGISIWTLKQPESTIIEQKIGTWKLSQSSKSLSTFQWWWWRFLTWEEKILILLRGRCLWMKATLLCWLSPSLKNRHSLQRDFLWHVRADFNLVLKIIQRIPQVVIKIQRGQTENCCCSKYLKLSWNFSSVGYCPKGWNVSFSIVLLTLL